MAYMRDDVDSTDSMALAKSSCSKDNKALSVLMVLKPWLMYRLPALAGS